MKIGFIRHSKAIEKEFWDKDNVMRPLSKNGIFRAKRFAAQLLKFYKHDIDYMITSDYVKTMETAEHIKTEIKPRHFIVDPVLNPGFDFIKFQNLIKSLPEDAEKVFIIGHSPDLPIIISEIIRDKKRMPYFKKPSIVEIDMVEFPYGKISFTYNLDDGEEFPFKKHEPYLEEVGEIPL